MKLFIEIVVFALFSYTIIYYIRIRIFLSKLVNQNEKNADNVARKQIIIAIPVLREQKCICDTIKYFRKITKDIPIILITTQKEIKENISNQQTTQDIIKKEILGKYSYVYWIDYPYTEGYMADQLNYMLDNLEKILNKTVDLKNTYLALYNADSRPSKQTFKEMEIKVREGNKVIQQYSYCMQNYDKLNGILKGFAIYQSNFEIKAGLINSFLNSKILYTHIVGHGLIIELDTLKKFGNFNTEFWCEDIYLGLQLRFNNIKITPLLSLENIETPDTFKKLIKQNAVWFRTTSQFFKIYKDILKKGQAKNRLNGIIGILNEFRCTINWIGFPIVLLLVITCSIIMKEYILFISVLISYLFYITINTISTIKIINILDYKSYKVNIKMIIYVFLATTISNVGPLYSVITNKKEKYKTER